MRSRLRPEGCSCHYPCSHYSCQVQYFNQSHKLHLLARAAVRLQCQDVGSRTRLQIEWGLSWNHCEVVVVLVGGDADYDSMFKVSLVGNFLWRGTNAGDSGRLTPREEDYVKKGKTIECVNPRGVLGMKSAGRIRNVRSVLFCRLKYMPEIDKALQRSERLFVKTISQFRLYCRCSIRAPRRL
jgi:hypothetical protein